VSSCPHPQNGKYLCQPGAGRRREGRIVESTGQRGTFGRCCSSWRRWSACWRGCACPPRPEPHPLRAGLRRPHRPGLLFVAAQAPDRAGALKHAGGANHLVRGPLHLPERLDHRAHESARILRTEQLNGQVGDIQDLIDRLGLSDVDLSDAISGSAVVGALGTVLSGLAGFLSSLFLVLFIVLFLLSEGSAISTGKPGDGSAAPVRALPGYCEERLPICSRMPVPWPTSMR
jgi:hypothetical protein